MKSFFYNRTAYRPCILNLAPPICFLELDDYFDTLCDNTNFLTHESVRMAENLCRRMADVEYFAYQLSEAQKDPNTFRASILIGTLLVAYFSACKSLFDAGAITLSSVYSLSLKVKQKDFSKTKFWKQLSNKDRKVTDRYTPYKDLFKEIVEWRDAAIHRLTPFVITHFPGSPNKVPQETWTVKMVAKPDTDYPEISSATGNISWVEPLHFHKKWRNQLIAFCSEVCQDIRRQA